MAENRDEDLAMVAQDNALHLTASGNEDPELAVELSRYLSHLPGHLRANHQFRGDTPLGEALQAS